MENTASVFRNEIKYLIDLAKANMIQSKLDKLLERDEHSTNSSYIVRSLYFDSINDIDYKTKLAGTEVRKKIRLRVYDEKAERCKLEIKQKNGDLQHKVSVWITKEDAVRLSECDYSVLTKYFDSSDSAAYIFSVMTLGCYKPVVLIEYDRIAYTYPLYNTRITIDMNVRCSESNLSLFSKMPMYFILQDNRYILEVKYNSKLMNFISDILKKYQITQCSISKYCIGRKVYTDFNF